MKKPRLISEQIIKYKKQTLKIFIYKATHFYDVILSGNKKVLLKLQEKDEHWDYFERTIFSEPILVVATTTKLDDAKYVVEKIKGIIKK